MSSPVRTQVQSSRRSEQPLPPGFEDFPIASVALSAVPRVFDPEVLCTEKDVGKNIKCSLCCGFLFDPVQDKCGHNFCSICVERLFEKTNLCPISGIALSRIDLIPAPQLLRDLIAEVTVQCDHRDFLGRRCAWIGSFEEFISHGERCELREVKCPNVDCGEVFAAIDFSQHQLACPFRAIKCRNCSFLSRANDEQVKVHASLCVSQPIACPTNCGAYVKRSDLEGHRARDCPNTVVSCPYHKEGCSQKLRRGELRAHLKETEQEHISLLAKTMEELSQENTALRTEIAGNRTMVAGLNQKIDFLAGQLNNLAVAMQALLAENQALKGNVTGLLQAKELASAQTQLTRQLYEGQKGAVDALRLDNQNIKFVLQQLSSSTELFRQKIDMMGNNQVAFQQYIGEIFSRQQKVEAKVQEIHKVHQQKFLLDYLKVTMERPAEAILATSIVGPDEPVVLSARDQLHLRVSTTPSSQPKTGAWRSNTPGRPLRTPTAPDDSSRGKPTSAQLRTSMAKPGLPSGRSNAHSVVSPASGSTKAQ